MVFGEKMILIKGILLGLAVVAPVGPIGLLCMNRTLRYGKKVGFISGLGAATADLIYGCIAGLGLVTVMHVLMNYSTWINKAGALFLIYIGIQTLNKKQENTAERTSYSLRSAYATTLMLTITNPMTIVFFLGIFAGMHIETNGLQSLIFVMGVFLGSALWWLTLSSMTSLLRKRMYRYLSWINVISGIIIIIFGVYGLMK